MLDMVDQLYPKAFGISDDEFESADLYKQLEYARRQMMVAKIVKQQKQMALAKMGRAEKRIEKLKKKGIKAECNTGCHYRYNHPDVGLSNEFLQILIDSGVDIITASDAHKPQDVGSYIKEASERIEKMKG